MNTRRSEDTTHRRSNSWSLRSPITGKFEPPTSRYGSGDQQHLMHSYDLEATGLSELAEDSDEDSSGHSGQKRTSFEDAAANGRPADAGGSYGPPRRANTIGRERVNTAGSKGFGR